MGGCGVSAVCTLVIGAIFYNLAADLYSRDFGSVLNCVFVFATSLYSIVVIYAQRFCTYGEPLNNLILGIFFHLRRGLRGSVS